MYFNDVFDQALIFWKKDIDVSDGAIDEEGNYFSTSLSMAWFEATDAFEAKADSNQWVDLMLWSMNRTLIKYAQKRVNDGVKVISIKDVDKSLFEADYKVVLQESKNKALIDAYKGLRR